MAHTAGLAFRVRHGNNSSALPPGVSFEASARGGQSDRKRQDLRPEMRVWGYRRRWLLEPASGRGFCVSQWARWSRSRGPAVLPCHIRTLTLAVMRVLR